MLRILYICFIFISITLINGCQYPGDPGTTFEITKPNLLPPSDATFFKSSSSLNSNLILLSKDKKNTKGIDSIFYVQHTETSFVKKLLFTFDSKIHPITGVRISDAYLNGLAFIENNNGKLTLTVSDFYGNFDPNFTFPVVTTGEITDFGIAVNGNIQAPFIILNKKEVRFFGSNADYFKVPVSEIESYEKTLGKVQQISISGTGQYAIYYYDDVLNTYKIVVFFAKNKSKTKPHIWNMYKFGNNKNELFSINWSNEYLLMFWQVNTLRKVVMIDPEYQSKNQSYISSTTDVGTSVNDRLGQGGYSEYYRFKLIDNKYYLFKESLVDYKLDKRFKQIEAELGLFTYDAFGKYY